MWANLDFRSAVDKTGIGSGRTDKTRIGSDRIGLNRTHETWIRSHWTENPDLISQSFPTKNGLVASLDQDDRER